LCMAGPPGIEPGTYGESALLPLNSLSDVNLRFTEFEKDLACFRDYLLVDEQKSKVTASNYVALVKRFFKWVDGPVTVDSMRAYLKNVKEKCSRDHYALTLSSLKAYFGRFKCMPQLVSTFKFPPKTFIPKTIPSRNDLKRFYEALPSVRMKAYFLLVASSGLRKGEVLSLTVNDVDFKLRMFTPHSHKGTSKHSWVSFFNAEAEEMLKEFRAHLTVKQRKSYKLIPISNRDFKAEWKTAQVKTGLKLTSKCLRDWFAEEMGKLGVADRYINAFQGRTPASVLARHYTDYNPEKLKEVYDKAGLKVLSD